MKAEDIATAERSILGCILLNSDHCLPIAVRQGVDIDWFSSPERALVWDAIVTMWADRQAVDAFTVLERARRMAQVPKTRHTGVELQASQLQQMIDDTPTIAHFEHYLRLGRYEAINRRVKKAGARWNEALADGVDAETAVRDFTTELTKVLSASTASRSINLQEQLEKVKSQYHLAHQKRIVEGDLEYTPGIPLPWKCVNFASQGVQEGLYYIGARPSVGKTAFVLNLMRYWCERGVHVAFNSLDMAIVPMLKRPVSEVSRVSMRKASFGSTSHEDLDDIDKAVDAVKTWTLQLLIERDVDVFRSWCMAAHAAGKLDIVIVDFVQLMTTRHRHGNDNEKLEYISAVLKSIALDLNIPVIALSQLNRQCEEDGGRVPTASDLRGSGALEQDATAVWILHADREVIKDWEKYPATRPLGLTAGQTENEFNSLGPVRLIIAKNQNGQAGAAVWFPFILYKKYCLFMLADAEAKPIIETKTTGSVERTIRDYRASYEKITHDWRNDPFEQVLKDHGCLTGYDLMTCKHLH